MRLFLLKIIYFFSLLLLWCLVNFLWGSFFLSKIICGSEKKDQIYVFGDSHTEYSLLPNDDNQLKNLSVSGEPLRDTYYKYLSLKKEIGDSSTVIVGVGYHSFYFYTETDTSKLQVNEMYNIINDNSLLLFYFQKMEKRECIKFLPFLYSLPIYVLNKERYGGYKEMKRNLDLSKDAACQRFRKHFENKSFDPNTISFLREICNNKAERVIIYFAPVHSNYYKLIPDTIKSRVDSLLASLVDNKKVFLLNYSNVELDDSCFYDSDHLNLKGSENITRVLLENIDEIKYGKKE
ncbi:hypothetical protein [Parabacteroides chinchillae]|uniref:Uncharacterized protein n=1 Tax=Parabacteroides chinchillae TaxID=871327 RepID=A0A8G2BX35_9BACT|nr:hypothetical protein [Parabacteroides chinchillae]SEF98757.1 hypothetical protein SAMN05444001_11147 [Parabacteroides chinchillae]